MYDTHGVAPRDLSEFRGHRRHTSHPNVQLHGESIPSVTQHRQEGRLTHTRNSLILLPVTVRQRSTMLSHSTKLQHGVSHHDALCLQSGKKIWRCCERHWLTRLVAHPSNRKRPSSTQPSSKEQSHFLIGSMNAMKS